MNIGRYLVLLIDIEIQKVNGNQVLILKQSDGISRVKRLGLHVIVSRVYLSIIDVHVDVRLCG